MDFLFDAIANVLAYFYDLTNSFGGAIILLTLAVMVVVTPLTLKSTRSMIAMQQMQPELRKLQAKYKDDRQKLNEEMMAFYKEHNINPLGGCLPLIVQMPVFIVLYRVLLGLVKLPGYGEDMGRAAGLFARNMAGGGTYAGYGTFDPGYLSHQSGLYQALDGVREMNFAGLDLAASATGILSLDGLVAALPYFVLVAIIGVTAWYQQKQIQARNAGNQPQVNPQQQMLMKIMPFFLPVISLTLPAGIVLYFLVSNTYRIAQQAFITRTMYDEAHKAGGDATVPGRHGPDRQQGPARRADPAPRPGRRRPQLQRDQGQGIQVQGSAGQGSGRQGSAGPRARGPRAAAKGGSAKGGGPAKGGLVPQPRARGHPPRPPPSRPAKAAGTKAGHQGRVRRRTRAAVRSASGEAAGSGAKAPARKAPARKAPAAPTNQNRSKKKRKRN